MPIENPLKSSSYYRKLAIIDHMRECMAKYYAYKDVDSDRPKVREWAKERLDRELMNLYILLGWEFSDNQSLYKEQEVRFEKKWKDGQSPGYMIISSQKEE